MDDVRKGGRSEDGSDSSEKRKPWKKLEMHDIDYHGGHLPGKSSAQVICMRENPSTPPLNQASAV